MDNPQGPGGLQGAFQDITALKEAEDAMRESAMAGTSAIIEATILPGLAHLLMLEPGWQHAARALEDGRVACMP